MQIDRVPGPAGAGIDGGLAFYRLDLGLIEKPGYLKGAAGPPLSLRATAHVHPRGIAVHGYFELPAKA